MYPFNYIKPASISDAVECLLRYPGAKPLAGGMTLIPTLKQRLSSPTHLIDLSQLDELKGIESDQRILRIGAATRHVEVERSKLVNQLIPSLSHLASLIGDQQVRNKGTLGGSVANSDPSADYPAAVLALKATILTNYRLIPADHFFTGLFETALNEAEIVIAFDFHIPVYSVYLKQKHHASGYALAGVYIAFYEDGEVRVSVTGAGPYAFRWKVAEEQLAYRGNSYTPNLFAELPLNLETLNHDVAASRNYRAHLVRVLARRGLETIMKCKGISYDI